MVMRKKLLVFFGKLLLLSILILGLFIGFVYLGVFGHVFSEKELKAFKNETASLVLSDQGTIIGKYFADNRTYPGTNQFQHNISEIIWFNLY